jgi:hypothetical protein
MLRRLQYELAGRAVGPWLLRFQEWQRTRARAVRARSARRSSPVASSRS